MKPGLDAAFHLLHGTAAGALATQLTQLPGYPFTTALPFVPDQRHCPVFLLSGLAEHTKNLRADCRASFLVTDAGAPNVLTAPRMTMVGDVRPFDAPRELVARFVRYQPDAQQYLALGDFAFFRLQPKRIRYIGGFAQMGWIEESDWPGSAILAPEDEAMLIDRFAAILPAGVTLLGVDCYGCDLERDGKRERQRFAAPAPAPTDVATVMESLFGTA